MLTGSLYKIKMQMSNLQIHVRRHKGQTAPHFCDVCRKTFIGRAAMLKHRAAAHGTISPKQEEDSSGEMAHDNVERTDPTQPNRVGSNIASSCHGHFR